MKVLAVASEIYPLVKTGGLADVVGALPGALKSQGIAVTTLVPGYPAIMAALAKASPVHSYADLFGGEARLVLGEAHGLAILALDAPHLFNRPGNPYLGPNGQDWPDNAQRFAALSRAAVDAGRGAIPGYVPDVLHLHDWQAALAAVHVRFGGGPRTVVTIHNIAFQGVFPPSIFASLELPGQAFAINGVEYYGSVGYLKGGLASADAITTVSPTYAAEICTPDFGMGLDGLLRERRRIVSGIVNGIDIDVWNPEKDAALAATYGASSLDKRIANKRAVEKRFGLDADDRALFCVVSRLTWQKGMDILAQSLEGLIESGGRLALLGSGEDLLQSELLSMAERFKGRVGVIIGYDEHLSHLLQGGSDAILIPSRFEPCGLTQLYGLRYGCIPIVARTGGLADTIIDANDAGIAAGVATGLQFSPVDTDTLELALTRAMQLHGDQSVWRGMQKRAMAAEVSWQRSAAAYAAIYRQRAQQ